MTDSTLPIPSLGRTVHYRLKEFDADSINRRRLHAGRNMTMHIDQEYGVQLHVGNTVSAGQYVAATIGTTFGNTPESAVNRKCHLDGADDYWATSVVHGEEPGQFIWPPRT